MSHATARAAPSPTYQRTAGLAGGIAAWVVFSGVVFTGTGLVPPNNALVGAAIAITAAYTAGWPTGGRLPAVVAPLVGALLGAWLVVSAVVLEPAELLFWNNVAAGALIALLLGASVVGALRSGSSATE